MNGGNPREDLIDHKNPELAMQLEHSPEWKDLSLNHLEGRTAAFFCYGDGGGDELDANGRPKILRHPDYFDPESEPFENMRNAYAPLVWQCRYGGVEVPDPLWQYHEFGRNEKYSDNQAEDMVKNDSLMERFDRWVLEFQNFVQTKGKVPAGRYRAAGYQAPGHKPADARLFLRSWKMRTGRSPKGSSPEKQHSMGLNDDAIFNPMKSTGVRKN